MAALEAIALVEGTPQLRAPGTGDTYSMPRKLAIAPEVNTNALAVTGFSLTGSDASSLLDLAGTWNTSGTPTAIKLNVTDTASNASSLLMDLQVGGQLRLSLAKSGQLSVGAPSGSNPYLKLASNGTNLWNIYADSGAVYFEKQGSSALLLVRSDLGSVQMSSATYLNWVDDVRLYRDAANTLALRNSTNAQTQRIYETYTDGSNYAFGYLNASSSGFDIGTTAAGTGTKRPVRVLGPSLASAEAVSALEINQTWNTSGTPTGIKLNVTDTASNAASLLMDLQVGGTSKVSITKAGSIRSNNAANAVGDPAIQWNNTTGGTHGFFSPDANTIAAAIGGANVLQIAAGNLWHRSNSAIFYMGASADVALARDAANTLALRNSTNAQTLRTYGTYTDSSNYRRVALAMTTAGVATLTAEGAGTGASGNVLHISSLPTSNPGPGILWNNAGTPAIGT